MSLRIDLSLRIDDLMCLLLSGVSEAESKLLSYLKGVSFGSYKNLISAELRERDIK